MVLLTLVQLCQAQKILQISANPSEKENVFNSGSANEAAVFIQCSKAIPLTFSSSMDKEVRPFEVVTRGDDLVYKIKFSTGDRYSGRELSISSAGYESVFYLLDLQPKQLVSLQVEASSTKTDSAEADKKDTSSSTVANNEPASSKASPQTTEEAVAATDTIPMMVPQSRANVVRPSAESLHTDPRGRYQVITYEWNKDTPVGIHYGEYKKKVGGFIEVDLNGKLFDAIRNDCTYGDKPEVNTSFGWTVKVLSPVWVFFGPGATAKFYYGKYEDGNYPDYKNHELVRDAAGNYKDVEKSNTAFAISPVIGVCVKYSFIAARLTYQYRWSVTKELQDYMKTSRLSLGIGFAF